MTQVTGPGVSVLTLEVLASLGSSLVRRVAEGISRTISSVPDTRVLVSRVGWACPKWPQINAFHVPVFSTLKTRGDVGTMAFFMLYKAGFETQHLALDPGQQLIFHLSCPHWTAHQHRAPEAVFPGM